MDWALLKEKQRTVNKLMLDEESALHQKIRVKWLKFEDRNNSFFHKMTRQKYNRNRINNIVKENVIKVIGEMGQAIVEYYIELFRRDSNNAYQGVMHFDHLSR